MPKFAKFILSAAALVLLAYVLAALGLNIYLQSEGLQSRIRSTAESAAGTPIQIQGTHYTPWSGFNISGVVVPGKSLPGQIPFLSAASVRFRFSLLGLLQGKLVVNEVIVRDATVTLFAPQPIPKAPVPARPAPSATPVVILVDQPPGGVEIVVPQPSAPAPPRPPVQVKKIRLTNGTVQFFDSKGIPVITLNGIETVGELLRDGNMTGTFRIAETTVATLLHPRQARGTFSWKDGRLTIPDLQTDWAGGRLVGQVEIGADKTISVSAAAEDILLKSLAVDAGLGAEGTRGRLFFKGNVQGTSGVPESFTGRMEASLQQARFLPFEPIRQIGELMRLQELQMFELKTAEVVCNIRDKKIYADTVMLESENLMLDAKGPIGFDGKMKVLARLHLNEKLRKDLRGLLGDNFKESEFPGYRQVPFAITGTIQRPKTDLLEKLTGFRISEDVGGLLKNLFRMPSPPKNSSDKEPGGG